MRTPRELPRLLNGEMVRATLEGRKTQTRQPIKVAQQSFTSVERYNWHPKKGFSAIVWDDADNVGHIVSPFGGPDDLLYIRETWRRWESHNDCDHLEFPCGCPSNGTPIFAAKYNPDLEMGTWIPSIHMPKEVARIWCRVKRVWVERVQHINWKDAVAEGVAHPCDLFSDLWDSIYKARGLGWEANPWVWACEWEVISISGRPEVAS